MASSSGAGHVTASSIHGSSGTLRKVTLSLFVAERINFDVVQTFFSLVSLRQFIHFVVRCFMGNWFRLVRLPNVMSQHIESFADSLSPSPKRAELNQHDENGPSR